MKNRVDLIRYRVLWEVAEVLTEGIEEHGDEWKDKKPEEYITKALRHMFKAQYEWKDESGHRHIIHAIADLMYAAELDNLLK